MKSIRRLFEKNFLGVFQDKGYRYSYLGANNFEITSCDSLTIARFDVPRLTRNCMRARLFQFYRNGWESFVLSGFYLEPPPQDEVYFKSEREFCQSVGTLVVNAQRCLSNLEQNKKALVVPKENYYNELSIQTSIRAQQFAQENHLSFLPLDMLSIWAEQWLQVHFLNQNPIENAEKVLNQKLHLLLPFCAYCGEIYCKEKNGRWMWYHAPNNDRYVVVWQNDGIDILGQVTEYLSYHTVVRTCKLFQ